MITKMKKLTFLVYHKEYEEFLNSLRELGVVHIVEKQQGAADNTELQENIRLSNRLTATLKLLQNQKHYSDAQFAGSSSVPAHVEMMGLIGAGNNPMVGMTVAVAVAVEEAAKAGKF